MKTKLLTKSTETCFLRNIHIHIYFSKKTETFKHNKPNIILSFASKFTDREMTLYLKRIYFSKQLNQIRLSDWYPGWAENTSGFLHFRIQHLSTHKTICTINILNINVQKNIRPKESQPEYMHCTHLSISTILINIYWIIQLVIEIFLQLMMAHSILQCACTRQKKPS